MAYASMVALFTSCYFDMEFIIGIVIELVFLCVARMHNWALV